MLDTSFVIAYFNTRDQNHRLALNTAKILDHQNQELYITDYCCNNEKSKNTKNCHI